MLSNEIICAFLCLLNVICYLSQRQHEFDFSRFFQSPISLSKRGKMHTWYYSRTWFLFWREIITNGIYLKEDNIHFFLTNVICYVLYIMTF